MKNFAGAAVSVSRKNEIGIYILYILLLLMYIYT